MLGEASRLRQLRITELHNGPIHFEPGNLETLLSMSSLTFLSFAQASPHCDSRHLKGCTIYTNAACAWICWHW